MQKFKDISLMVTKLILFLTGFVACLLMLTTILFVLTQMSFSDSIATAAFPSLLTGIWCSIPKKQNLKI